MELVKWDRRPPEEAHLFNPAFCGALICEFVNEYQKSKDMTVPFVLPFCAIPIALHPKSRGALPNTTTMSMYTWIERNSNTMIGYEKRAKSLTPVIREAIRFDLDREVLTVVDGNLEIGKSKATFTPKYFQYLTNDAQECVIASRFLGRWFAKAEAPSTILSSWGIRP